jgi:hypothetical protein
MQEILDRTEATRRVDALLGESNYMLVFKDGDIKPSLCFGRIGGTTLLPDTVKQVDAALAELNSISPSYATKIGQYNLYTDSETFVSASKNEHISF